MRTLTSREALGGTLQRAFETVWQYLNSLESVTVGPAVALYHMPCDDMLDVSAGFPVQDPVEAVGRLTALELPAGRAATLLHVGPYDGLFEAHQHLDRWISQQGHVPTDVRYEIYWVDPGQVKNSEELRTEIVVPLG